MISYSILCVALIALLPAQSSATISCYVCGTTDVAGVQTNSACLPGITSSQVCSTAVDAVTTNCVAVLTGCTSCVTEHLSTTVAVATISASSSSYARTCLTGTSSSVKNGCTTTTGASDCYYTCSTNLCNYGNKATGIQRLSLASTLLAILASIFCFYRQF